MGERYEAAQNKVKEKTILILQKGKISIDEIQTFSQNYLMRKLRK